MARTCWPSDLEPRPLAQARQIRPAAPVGAKNLGPGRQIVSQDSPDGVSRLGGQAGTQAPTLRPHHRETTEAGPGSTTHILPADLCGIAEERVRRWRHDLGVRPVYHTVDTCAAEFEARTPYLYSTYDSGSEVPAGDRPKVIILGSG